MVNVATTGDTAINDEFMPIPIPEGASIEEQLAIIMANIERHKEKRARDMASLIAKTKQRFRDWDQQIEQNAREAREQFYKPFLSSDKQTTQHAANITSEFTTLREEGSSLANSQQGELERQKPAREEVISETNLPIGGNQPKGLTGESQPYTEAVHGEGHQQDCSSDKKVVSEQISDFSTDQAKYVATDQMHGGQDMAHDHPFDQKKQVHDHFNCDSATGRLGEGDQNQSQLNYQLSCGLQKPICGFINQFNLKFFIYSSRPSGGFDICGGHIYNPRCMNGQNNYSSGQVVLRNCKFEYHQYKLTLVYNYPASEALDVENSDQQVVVYNGQSVANPEDTMFYDMVVGDKADLETSSSPKVQLKIMLRQPTKILGGQDYSSYEPNFSQVFDAKYLYSFPTSSHKRGFHTITFDTSELGMKHRWPPP